MPDDIAAIDNIITKKILSYRGLIPSEDFNSDFYYLYLNSASSYELQYDIILRETFIKIAKDNPQSF